MTDVMCLALVVVCILTLSACRGGQKGEIADTFDAFVEAIKAEDYDTAKTFIAPDSPDLLKDSGMNLAYILFKDIEITRSDARIEGNTATLVVHVKGIVMDQAVDELVTVECHQYDTVWKLYSLGEIE